MHPQGRFRADGYELLEVRHCASLGVLRVSMVNVAHWAAPVGVPIDSPAAHGTDVVC